MPHTPLRIALAQHWTVPGDVAGNGQRIGAMVCEAAERGADAVLFSECALTGYDLLGRCAAAAVSLDCRELQALAAQAVTRGVWVCVGVYERTVGRVYNAAVVMGPAGQRYLQRKASVVGAEAALGVVQRGSPGRVIFDVNGWRCGVLICAEVGREDLWTGLADSGVDVAWVLTAGAGSVSIGRALDDVRTTGARDAFHAESAKLCYPTWAVDRALRMGMAVACVNQCGWEPESGYFHPGESFVVEAGGRLNTLAPGTLVFEHLRPRLDVAELPAPVSLVAAPGLGPRVVGSRGAAVTR